MKIHPLQWLRQFFGHISYTPPQWWIRSVARGKKSRAGEWLAGQVRRARANPRQTASVAGGLLLVLIGVGVGVDRYLAHLAAQPQPDYVTVTLIAPNEPDLETGVPDKLIFHFSKSAARVDQLDKPIVNGVTLRPNLRGLWHWETDQKLVFTPEKSNDQFAQWLIGESYRVEFSRKLFPDHVVMKELEFKFETPRMQGHFTKAEFYQDPKDPNIKRAVFNLRFNYALDTEDLKKRLSLEMKSKDDSVLGQGTPYAYTVSFGKYQNEAFVVSDPIPIPKSAAVMKLAVEKGARAALGGESTKDELTGGVDIPGMYEYFRFEESSVSFARNAKFEPEQILLLTTRAELPTEVLAKSLKLYVLPKRKKKEESQRRYSQWGSASEVTPEVRQEMAQVKFQVVPSAEENSKLHTFKIDVPVGRFLYLEVAAGLKSYGGYELLEKFEDVVGVGEYPKELMIMSQGAILSFGGDKKLPLLARNIRQVEFEVFRILPSQLNQFVYQNFRYGESFSMPNFSVVTKDTLSEVFKKKVDIPFTSPAATQYFSLDLDPYLESGGGVKKGIFFVEVSDQQGRSDQRLVVVTDLGLVVKENSDRSHDVFVQNLRTGLPVEGAEISVIGANGVSVVEQRTNGEGRVSFPDLRNFKFEKRPIAFVANKGGDMAYLPFRMSNRKLDFSRFDVGGLETNSDSDQLTAFLFSDRGIYRPGDTVNLGLMVRSRNWKKHFNRVPLMWSVTDARGIEVKREKLDVSSDDLTALSFTTQDSGATGLYQVRVFITKKEEGDELIGSLALRIEEFLPDSMRIAANIEGSKIQGWMVPGKMKGLVTLKNLFGTPAEARRVEAELLLMPTQPRFKAFQDYDFSALKGDERAHQETLNATETNANGEATFELDLTRFAGGMYSLRLDAEGFAAGGGRGVGASAGTLISAFPYLLGLKADGSLNYVPKDSKHSVHLIAISPELQKIAVDDVAVAVVERKYVSALMQQSDGTYKYQSVLKEQSGELRPIVITAAGTSYSLPTATPGDFVAVFKNKAGVELNRVFFSVAGEANLSRSLERNAELQVTLNKSDYKPGEEIELQIRAPYVGSGLITIERDRVLSHKWFRTTTTASLEKIRIPAGVEGNAYINVTFLRAMDSPEIFMSPLSYAAVPFSISLDEHKIQLDLRAPATVKPGEKLSVQYSASRKTKLILYGVDEGILQVAGYRLPDPLRYFFQRQSLQVLTYQLLDLLLPEYSVLKKLAAPGGDEASRSLGKNLNPFKRKTDKPVVFWSGVLEAGPGVKTFTYEVPDHFNGNLKVMAVASNGSGFGAAEQGVISRGDFVITSNIPTFVVPGDEFTVGVSVSNQAEGTGAQAAVKLDLETEAFEVLGPSTQTLTIDEGREGAAEFRLKAKSELGSRSIRFRAAGGNKSARSTVETSVRPALPYVTTLAAGRVPKADFTLDVPRDLLPEFRVQTASLAPVPLNFAQGLKVFLDAYSFDCSEQLASRAFPYVVLKSRPEFAIDSKKANQTFGLMLDILRARQTNDGGFGMYVGAGQGNRPISLYVAHLLLEAKERGFAVPEDILSKILSYLESEPLRDTTSLEDARQFAYSLYLRARAGRVPGDDLKSLHQNLKAKFKGRWEQDLTAGWLAATFRLVKQEDLATQMFRTLEVSDKVTSNYHYFYDELVRNSALLFLGARHFPEMLKDLASDKAMMTAFRPLERGLYNTHSAAYTILALDAFARAGSKAELVKQARLDEILANGESVELRPEGGLLSKANFSERAKKLRYRSPADFPFFYVQIQQGFDRELPRTEIRNKLEIHREFVQGDTPVTAAKMGQEVKVRLRVRSLDVNEIDHVVLVDLLPSGLEPVLESVAINSAEDHGHGGSLPGEPRAEEEHYDDEGESGEGEEGEGASHRFFNFFFPEAIADSLAKAGQSAVRALTPQYVDRREDRLVIYTRVTADIQEFVYRAKAIAKGKFVVPPSYGESMYDRSVSYRGVATEFTVEAP